MIKEIKNDVQNKQVPSAMILSEWGAEEATFQEQI